MVRVHDRFIPIHEKSKLIKSLQPIRKIRIYTSIDKKDEIYHFVKEFIRDREKEVSR